MERIHEVLIVFGALFLQQRLQFLYQHVGFGDMFRRSLDHLSESAEVLRPDEMQEHLGVEGRGQDTGFLSGTTSLFFFPGDFVRGGSFPG